MENEDLDADEYDHNGMKEADLWIKKMEREDYLIDKYLYLKDNGAKLPDIVTFILQSNKEK